MIKKFFFFSILFLLLFFSLSDFGLAAKTPCGGAGMPDCPEGQRCLEGKCERALEISYPKVPGGGIVPETTATGLPDYVKYIFQLSVAIIGFVIFAVMVYNGVVFLSSTGNPAKLSDAREGILSAFLGTIILLSAYIIFNTINPQLTILKLAEVSPLGGVVTPGVYICNYNVDTAKDIVEAKTSINDLLEKYINKDGLAATSDQQIWAAKTLRALNCPRVNSANLNGWVVKPDNTMFIVPELSYVWNKTDNKTVKQIKYEYGIVLHEKDNWKGKCDYFPKEDPDNFIYTHTTSIDIPGNCYAGGGLAGQQINGCRPERLGFEARSITVFKKPAAEPPADARGIMLYPCIDFSSTEGMCPKSVTDPTGFSYPMSGADILKVGTATGVFKLDRLTDNVRSVFIEPEGSYFALLFDEDDFKGECTGIHSSSRDVRNKPLEKRGPDCDTWRLFWNFPGLVNTRECALGVRSMIVIKGQAI